MKAPRVRVLATVGLLLGAALALAGCGVTSDNPLSDDATSILDPRLVGRWEPVEADPAAPGREMDIPHPIWVGRHREAKQTLEAAAVALEEDGTLRVDRMVLYCTTLGERRFLSARSVDGDRYALLLYEMPDEDTVRLLGLDEAFVTSAVRSGALSGTVVDDPRSVRITAPTEALRAWVTANAETCFDPKGARTFRRVKPPAH